MIRKGVSVDSINSVTQVRTLRTLLCDLRLTGFGGRAVPLFRKV